MLSWFPLVKRMFIWNEKNGTMHEDVFWSLYVPSLNPFFKLPNIYTALKFSFEKFPSKCFKENNQQLPFGCHAWGKYEFEFWKPFIKNYGYNV